MIALKTTTWGVAKLRHADNLNNAEKQRQRTQKEIGGDVRMGTLIDRHKAQYLADTSKATKSKAALVNMVQRLEGCWLDCFGWDLREAKPSKTTADQARQFANFLHSKAKKGQGHIVRTWGNFMADRAGRKGRTRWHWPCR